MNKPAIMALLTSIMILHPRYLNAQSMNTDGTILGYGMVSCGTWTKFRQAGDISSAPLEGWVMGFLSGYNMWNDNPKELAYVKKLNDKKLQEMADNFKDITAGIDQNGVFASIDKYCYENPADLLETATFQFASGIALKITKSMAAREKQSTEDAVAHVLDEINKNKK